MFINKNEPIIVAVSGGPDSMYLLNDLIKQEYKNIFVCHVNYNFRDNSINDQKLVEEFCEKNNLRFELKVIDKNIYKENIGNFEKFAREQRYNFFVEIAKQNKIKYAFIGHNLNDSIETYILQKERNSLVNYYGLQMVSDYKGLTIVRPILNKKKSEILAFNKQNNIKYIIDSTNSDQNYARNKVRANLKEEEFPKYIKEIKEANVQNEKLKNEAKFYANNNLTASELNVNENFYKYSDDLVMLILIEYLKIIKKDKYILNRSNNTLREIARIFKTSDKKFIKVQVGDHFFIKDYNFIYFVEKEWFNFYRIEIKSKDDLEKLKQIQEWVHAEQAINKDGFKFPYLVTNDYEYYKTFSKVKGKKANRYFIDRKIPYKSRYQKVVVINLNTNEILNIKRMY